ncbi:uncharacterized protein [Triticum aestivum]|uniref:uncharacterized protein isoform X1 n=1 Tax=Triticum aestivum TaxID=4565 RepID=UPI001D010001|nr:uncharacterized protein LOC123151268 isoform X1 [Triticum aestivum]
METVGWSYELAHSIILKNMRAFFLSLTGVPLSTGPFLSRHCGGGSSDDAGGTTKRRWLPLSCVEYFPFPLSRGSASSAATTDFSDAPLHNWRSSRRQMRIEILPRNLRAEDVCKGLGRRGNAAQARKWQFGEIRGYHQSRVRFISIATRQSVVNLNLGVHDLTSF